MIYQPPVQPFYPNSVSQHYARRHHNSSHSLRDFYALVTCLTFACGDAILNHWAA